MIEEHRALPRRRIVPLHRLIQVRVLVRGEDGEGGGVHARVGDVVDAVGKGEVMTPAAGGGSALDGVLGDSASLGLGDVLCGSCLARIGVELRVEAVSSLDARVGGVGALLLLEKGGDVRDAAEEVRGSLVARLDGGLLLVWMGWGGGRKGSL